MIFRYLILGLLWVMQSAVNRLPVGPLPDGVYSAFDTAAAYLAGWNDVFPIDTLVQVVKYVVIFQSVVFGWHAAVWVYGRIRGVSGK